MGGGFPKQWIVNWPHQRVVSRRDMVFDRAPVRQYHPVDNDGAFFGRPQLEISDERFGVWPTKTWYWAVSS